MTRQKIDTSKVYVPTALQLAFHKHPANGRVMLGGNRTGKSTAGTLETGYYAEGKHPYRKIKKHNYLWIINQDYTQQRAAISGQGKRADPNYALATRWLGRLIEDQNRATKTIYFKSGSMAEYKSCASGYAKFGGAQIDFAWFDEVPEKRVFEEVMFRLTDNEGSWILTATPTEGIACWTYKYFWENRGDPQEEYGLNHIGEPLVYYNKTEDVALFNPTMYDNKNIVTGELNLPVKQIRARERMGEYVRKVRVFGQWALAEGLVFADQWKPDDHIVDHFDIPDHWDKYRGIDFGWSQEHPYVCVFLAHSPSDKWYIYDEWVGYGDQVLSAAEAIRKHTGNQNIKASVCDATGSERITALNKAGIKCIKGKRDPAARVDTIKALLDTNRLFVMRNKDGNPSAPNFCENMAMFAWPKPRSAGSNPPEHPKPRKKYDDSIDAAGYVLIQGFRPPDGPVEEEKPVTKEEAERQAIVRAVEQLREENYVDPDDDDFTEAYEYDLYEEATW